MSYLEIAGVGKRFDEHPVLVDLSLTLVEGEMLALLGLSGSGKTTLLRVLAGFETPDRGRLVIDGEDVTGVPAAKRGIGMVFQHYALFPHMTVGENVAFGLAAQRLGRETTAARVADVLSLVDLLGFEERRVSAISGGQQQRVALARALAPRPRVLLLDEPLSNLDPALRERTRRELREAVRAVGITTVLVTHEQEEAFHLGDRVAVLHQGRLEQVGAPEALYRAPASSFVATFIGRASTLAGRVADPVDGAPADERVAGDEVAVRVGRANGDEEGVATWSGVAATPLSLGQPVALIARPESLRLTPARSPEALRGRIVERRFTGAASFYQIALSSGEEVLVDVAYGEHGAGDEVWVAPLPANATGPPRPRIFAAAEGDGERG